MSKHQMPSYDKKQEPVQEQKEPMKNQSIKCKVTDCQSLNVRKGPSMDAPINFVVVEDTVLFAKEIPEEDWVFVIDQSSSRTGYAMVKYLEEI